MRALAAIALTLTFAPAAAAETVAQRTPVVGPVFAGDAVAWGEESPRGATRVMLGAPGRESVLVYRLAPATARKTERSFSGMHSAFAASATRFAALLTTATVIFAESDSVSTATTDAAVGGPLRGPVGIFAGCLPRRGDLGCGATCAFIQGVDVDGARTAVASSTRVACDEREVPPRHAVTVHDGARTVTVTGGEGFRIADVELAGRFVAWVEDSVSGPEVLRVHDLERGAEVVRLTGRDVDARTFWAIGLQADGTVAATFSGRRDRRGARLGVIAPGTPGVRLLARHVGNGLAIASGRVLYEHVISYRRNETRLVLRSLADGRRTVLARLHERRRLTGDFDLDANRATWAELPTRRGYEPAARGPARIIVRSL